MINEMYYDRFINRYISVEERNDVKYAYAPPERFVRVFRGNDVFIETYELEHKKLRVSYTNNEVLLCLVNDIRKEKADRHDFDLENALLIDYTIPSDNFDAYAKYYRVGESM